MTKKEKKLAKKLFTLLTQSKFQTAINFVKKKKAVILSAASHKNNLTKEEIDKIKNNFILFIFETNSTHILDNLIFYEKIKLPITSNLTKEIVNFLIKINFNSPYYLHNKFYFNFSLTDLVFLMGIKKIKELLTNDEDQYYFSYFVNIAILSHNKSLLFSKANLPLNEKKEIIKFAFELYINFKKSALHPRLYTYCDLFNGEEKTNDEVIKSFIEEEYSTQDVKQLFKISNDIKLISPIKEKIFKLCKESEENKYFFMHYYLKNKNDLYFNELLENSDTIKANTNILWYSLIVESSSCLALETLTSLLSKTDLPIKESKEIILTKAKSSCLI